MTDEARLVAAFQEMRRDEGVTLEKLRARTWLLDLLQTALAEEGKKQLEELVHALGDGLMARCVRNALVLGDGVQARGGLEDRRAWAEGTSNSDAFIPRRRRSQIDNEDRGFLALARLILDRATQAEIDPFQNVEPIVLEDDELDEPTDTSEARPVAASRPSWKFIVLCALIGAILAFIVIAIYRGLNPTVIYVKIVE